MRRGETEHPLVNEDGVLVLFVFYEIEMSAQSFRPASSFERRM